MADYGVLPTGFRRKPQSVILADIERRQLAGISPDWDVSTESPMGQVNGIMARDFSTLWEALEVVFNSNDPDKAEEALLTALSKLTGTIRQEASYSTAPVAFTLTLGTIIQSGINFIQDASNPASRWTPAEDFTSPADGTYTKQFRAENTGPTTAAAGALSVISTPVVGWVLVPPYNATDAVPGRNIEEDPELRQSREQQITNSAGASIDGIFSALSKLLDDEDVTSGSVLVFENVTADVDANGLPGDSFEAIVFDGTADGTGVAADVIAQTIWKKKGSGARSFGTSVGTALDARGGTQLVQFSRFDVVSIYIEFDLETLTDFDATAFKLAVATEADRVFTGGSDVFATRLIAIAWQQPNVKNVLAVRLGLAASPTLSVDLPMSIRQIARFDSSRIVAP
jgi:Baseplate J-like protein